MNTHIPFLWIMLLLGVMSSSKAKKSEGPIPSNFTFTQLSQKDGLSQNNVNDIIQDQRGFLWIATANGLNRYDGHEFLHFYGMDGLPNDQVTSLLETQDGMIWLGTRNGGLARLDPATMEFDKFLPAPEEAFGLKGSIIQSLYEDTEGRLWIGNFRGGLQYLDRNSRKFYSIPDSIPGLANGAIYGILEENSGRFWAGTNGGLYELSNIGWTEAGEWTGEINKFVLFPDASEQEIVFKMCVNPAGGIWMNIWRKGLVFLDANRGKQQLFIPQKNKLASPKSARIKHMMVDQQDRLWLCNFDAGLSVMDIRSATFVHLRHEAGSGLNLKSDFTTCALQDRSGVIWVGTYGSGLNHYSPYREKFVHYEQQANNVNSLSNNYIFAFEESRLGPPGTLWIGTHRNGANLMVQDPVSGRVLFRHFPHDPEDPYSLSYNAVLAMEEDHEGNLWVGTFKGLNLLSADQAKSLAEGQDIRPRFERITTDSPKWKGLTSNSVWSLCEDRQDRLWVGTHQGLHLYIKGEQRFISYVEEEDNPQSISNQSVSDIFQDSQNRLWLGTHKGINVLETIPEPDEKLEFISWVRDPQIRNGLQGDWVLDIVEDQSGRIWVATRSGGLHVLEENADLQTSTWRVFDMEDGLSSNSIKGLILDQLGQIWVSTNSGLSSFFPDSLLHGIPASIHNFSVKDGLQGNEFSDKTCLMGRDGRVYFGGINGFNGFYPQDVRNNPQPPSVYLTGIRILDRDIHVKGNRTDGKLLLEKDLPFTEKLGLTYRDYSFTLFFSALDYTFPTNNQYAYRLEGFDDQWRRNGIERSATYTNLDPGSYTFRLRASNSDGVWNTEEHRMEIIVSPPPWKSWWAYTLYALAIVGLIYAYLRFQIREREKQFETQLQIESARQEEREQVRKRTAADFHDELGHKMTKISLFVELAKRTAPAQEALQNYLAQVSDQTQVLSEGIRDFIWILDPDKDSLLDAMFRMKDFGEELFAHTETAFRTVGISQDFESIKLPLHMRRHLVLLFKEAMNNALKYADASELHLGVEKGKEQLVIFCKDNGVGFGDGKAKGGGYGMKNMKSRAEQMGGQLAIQSEIGEGTKIQLNLPIPQMGD
ncbi:MAG: two-component regulator propeller domain-containing protein [Bacteroidota bacterium]